MAGVERVVERRHELTGGLVSDRPQAAHEGARSTAQEGLGETAHLRAGRRRLADPAGVQEDQRAGVRGGVGEGSAEVLDAESDARPVGARHRRRAVAVVRESHLPDRRHVDVVANAVAGEVEQVDVPAGDELGDAGGVGRVDGGGTERLEVRRLQV
nr:hypothetical protein [Nocardioides immobilis]